MSGGRDSGDERAADGIVADALSTVVTSTSSSTDSLIVERV